MAELIRMPKMSDTMQQGVVNRWLKQVGDSVVAGDILAEIETDKAIMELESYEAGVLLYIGIAAGSAAQVNAVIAIIGAAGEDIAAWLEAGVADSGVTQPGAAVIQPGAAVTQPGAAVTQPGAPVTQPVAPITAAAVTPVVKTLEDKDKRLLASPLAKKIAKERGWDMGQIAGSGTGGRIVKRDILEVVAHKPVPRDEDVAIFAESYHDLPISPMRQKLATVLTESKAAVPHFYLTISIYMDKIMALRLELNRQLEVKISMTDLVVKAAALALKKHPKINAAWMTRKIRVYEHVHMGIAVALAEGVAVPVVRFADQKSLLTIHKEIRWLIEEAQQERLQPPHTLAATFTISNLGMFGIESFVAIVNPPAACILAVGAIQELPMVQDHQIVATHLLKVTLSCDHRVVDGVVGASFLATLKAYMEQPLQLLV